MNHLRKITISNARRMGEVEIDFDQGATIILAPNGTGKTTLFEAIEFALTGAVSRLDTPPLSIIRNQQEGMFVKLDFGNEICCEVKYVKDGAPVKSGNHDVLFPGLTGPEISNLLRITHLLEQRANSWFMHKSKSYTDAGVTLSHLALGKDLQKIADTKTGTLNAATREVERLSLDQQLASFEVQKFEELLEKRKKFSFSYELVPLKDLENSLIKCAALLKVDVTGKGLKLEMLMGLLGEVQNSRIAATDRNLQLRVRLSGLNNLTDAFARYVADITTREEALKKKREELKKLDADLIGTRKEVSDQTGALNVQQKDLKNLQDIRQVFEKLKSEEDNLKEIERKISALQADEKSNTVKVSEKKPELEKLKELQSRFVNSRKEEEDILKRQNGIKGLEPVVIEWQDHLNRIESLEKTEIPASSGSAEIQKRDMLQLEQEIQNIENEFTASLEKLNATRRISDSIQSAIALISENLPANEDHCPVCSAEYEPSELSKRIGEAAKNVSPVLKTTLAEHTAIESRREALKLRRESLMREQGEVQNRLRALNDELNSIRRNIREKCAIRFPGINAIEQARAWMAEQTKIVTEELERVRSMRVQLGTEPVPVGIQTLSNEIDEINRLLADIAARLRELGLAKNQSTNTINDYRQSVQKSTPVSVTEAIVKLQGEISRLSPIVNEAKVKQGTLENKKEELEKEVLSEDKIVSRTKEQRDQILADWKDAGLSGQPQLDVLNKRLAELNEEDKKLKEATGELERISGELSRWQVAEKYEEVDREIKTLCKGSTDDVHLNKLKADAKEAKGKHTAIKAKQAALSKLYTQVNTQMGKVHDQIKTINPLWTSLLRKVVVNPIFDKADISSYLYRNKSHAEVKTGLHNTRIDVMQIASEAQATDLQLTFMMAMASSYNWTPWKALLLDDPTQHHDLVHAAGVFDLLRDYIIEQKFQVLLGTHDSVQARFFQRKLENDGVPVRVLSLVADDNGVKVEQI